MVSGWNAWDFVIENSKKRPDEIYTWAPKIEKNEGGMERLKVEPKRNVYFQPKRNEASIQSHQSMKSDSVNVFFIRESHPGYTGYGSD